MYTYTAPAKTAEVILDNVEFKGDFQAMTTNHRSEIIVVFDRSDDLETFVKMVSHAN